MSHPHHQWRNHVDHAEQHLHRQAGLDGVVAIAGLPTSHSGRLGRPSHLGVEPDRQRAPALARLVVSRPVPGLVGRCVLSAHPLPLLRWSHKMNPRRPFVQQSLYFGEMLRPANLAPGWFSVVDDQ